MCNKFQFHRKVHTEVGKSMHLLFKDLTFQCVQSGMKTFFHSFNKRFEPQDRVCASSKGMPLPPPQMCHRSARTRCHTWTRRLLQHEWQISQQMASLRRSE